MLLPATEDRLHQPYRRNLMAPSMALVDELRAAGYAAVISGAGATVLALIDSSSAQGRDFTLANWQRPHFTGEIVDVDVEGLRVEAA